MYEDSPMFSRRFIVADRQNERVSYIRAREFPLSRVVPRAAMATREECGAMSSEAWDEWMKTLVIHGSGEAGLTATYGEATHSGLVSGHPPSRNIPERAGFIAFLEPAGAAIYGVGTTPQEAIRGALTGPLAHPAWAGEPSDVKVAPASQKLIDAFRSAPLVLWALVCGTAVEGREAHALVSGAGWHRPPGTYRQQ